MSKPGLGGGGLPPDRKSAYSYEELLACARGELFDPDSAKLPLPDMLMTRPGDADFQRRRQIR